MTDDLRHDHHGCALCKSQRNAAADRIAELEAALRVKDSHDHFDCTADRSMMQHRIDELEATQPVLIDAIGLVFNALRSAYKDGTA